jgi:hypothetical protein
MLKQSWQIGTPYSNRSPSFALQNSQRTIGDIEVPRTVLDSTCSELLQTLVGIETAYHFAAAPDAGCGGSRRCVTRLRKLATDLTPEFINSGGPGRPGARRRLQVRTMRSDLIVQARKGLVDRSGAASYYVPKANKRWSVGYIHLAGLSANRRSDLVPLHAVGLCLYDGVSGSNRTIPVIGAAPASPLCGHIGSRSFPAPEGARCS